MIIPEFIGYVVEAIWLTIWRSRIVRSIRFWASFNPDRRDLVAMVIIALVWATLCLWGIA